MNKTPKSFVNQKCQASRFIIVTLLIFGFQVSAVVAQHIKIGTDVYFVNGASVNINDAKIVNLGTIKNNPTGSIKLTGNWQNDGVFVGETGSIVTLDGAVAQEIGGANSTIFVNMSLNNNTGFSLGNDVSVNGTLDFQNGMLTTGNHSVTIGTSGIITNADSTKYVDGKLINTYDGTATKVFPIGKGGNYRPVSFQYTTLTGTSLVAAEQFESGLTGALPANTTLLTTGRYWAISQTGGSNLQYFVTLDPAGYTPARPVLMLKQNSGVIDAFATTAPNYTNAAALTSFSDFGLGELCINPTNGGVIAEDQNSCNSFDPLEITSSSLPSGNTGALIYQWQKSIINGTSDFTNIDGATGTSYNPGTIIVTTWFRRLARVDCKPDWSGAIASNAVKMTIYPNFTVGSAGTSHSICYNSTPNQLTGTPPTGGNTPYSYQWQSSTINGTFTDISGATTLNFQPGTLNQTTFYRQYQTSASGCGTLTTNVVTITVDPTTVGGIATGGGIVCYGTNSTLLTLLGQVGSVLKWQYLSCGPVSSSNPETPGATDSESDRQLNSLPSVATWIDIPGTTNTTYTAINLTTNTWFRAVVKSGECLIENSEATLITMFGDYHISGYAKYDNNPKTPLDGLKITLKQNGIAIKTPYITGVTGFYEFTGLINGTYSLDIASAHTSGQWQTWNGVNNTDYLLVYRHATNFTYLSENPPVVRITADVKSPQTPPFITTADADAIRMAAKYGWGSPTPYFEIPKWVFSGLTAETSITEIPLNCSNVTRNIMGLCAGDVNGSYLPPTGNKTGVETQNFASLQLINRGTLPITPEITFPVRAVETQNFASLQIGAITLMLDFDPSLIEITGVTMPDKVNDAPYFFVKDKTLNIGWMSLNPLRVAGGETVLMIHARIPNSEFRNPKSETPIRFVLNENPLSELADGDGNVIYNAKLLIADAGNASLETRNNMVTVYPNPTSDILNIEYLMNQDGTFTAELVNLTGVVVVKTDRITSKTGMNKATMNLRDLPNGAYMLKVTLEDQTEMRKVVVNR